MDSLEMARAPQAIHERDTYADLEDAFAAHYVRLEQICLPKKVEDS